MSIRVHKGFWTREEVARDVDSVYVFGDNIQDNVRNFVPSQTQAVIRFLPNAVGIVTKKNRFWETESFFTDLDFEIFAAQLEVKIDLLKFYLFEGKNVIFPSDGLGTGKAQLKEKAPKCWEYLCKRLKEEFDFDNGQISANENHTIN